MKRKAEDVDRWIKGMRRSQAKLVVARSRSSSSSSSSSRGRYCYHYYYHYYTLLLYMYIATLAGEARGRGAERQALRARAGFLRLVRIVSLRLLEAAPPLRARWWSIT